MEEWTKILLEVSPTLLEITGKDSVVILVTVQASQLYECWKTVFFFFNLERKCTIKHAFYV